MPRELIDEETADKAVEMYVGGEKITTIEKELGVSRSSLYYLLKQRSIAPERAKPAVRLRGDDHDLTHWVMAYESLRARVEMLEEYIVEAGLAVPPED